MPEARYNTNPSNYQHLLAAGVSSRQIRDAINSGLNPSQLPPEYFGLSGGYTPQSVGPGPTPSNQIGGIDIPPASMADPYAWSRTPQANAGGPMSLGGYGGSPSTGLDLYGPSMGQGNLPTSNQYGWSPPNYPGSISQNVGGPMSLGGYGGVNGGFDLYGSPIDWGNMSSYQNYGWSPVDYSSSINQSVGGPMSMGGYSPNNYGGLDLYGSPIDYGYLPSSNQYGWQPVDYSSNQNASSSPYLGSPADIYAGSVEGSSPWTEPGALPGTNDPYTGTVGQTTVETPTDIPVPEGFGQLIQPQDIPDWGQQPAQSQPIDPYASNIVGYSNGQPVYGNTPLGNSVINYTPSYAIPGTSGVYQSGTWIPNNGIAGTSYGNMGYSLMGVPGTFVSTPSGQTYNTAVGTSMHMFEGDSSGSSPPGGWGSLAHPVTDFWIGMGPQGKQDQTVSRHRG